MIIFDLDGTLIDSSEGILSSISYVLKKYDLRIENGLSERQFIGPPLRKQFMIACHVTEDMASILNEEFVQYYEERCLSMFSVYDGVLKVLKEFRKKKILLCVATYKPYNQTDIILRKCALKELFTYVACSDKNNLKSKADLLIECCDSVCSERSNTFYVGDTINDKIAADNAGIKFIAAKYGFGDGFETDCLSISSIKEILKLGRLFNEDRI